jgi:hypothetical protein
MALFHQVLYAAGHGEALARSCYSQNAGVLSQGVLDHSQLFVG